MRFENPVALFLLLLIPLLLFLRRKRTRARLPVANLYLWQESTTRDVNTLARRIRRDWLLIVQAACLAGIAFAIAVRWSPTAAAPLSLSLTRRSAWGHATGRACALMSQRRARPTCSASCRGGTPSHTGSRECGHRRAVCRLGSRRPCRRSRDSGYGRS
jgi:hypothetical protein